MTKIFVVMCAEDYDSKYPLLVTPDRGYAEALVRELNKDSDTVYSIDEVDYVTDRVYPFEFHATESDFTWNYSDYWWKCRTGAVEEVQDGVKAYVLAKDITEAVEKCRKDVKDWFDREGK